MVITTILTSCYSNGSYSRIAVAAQIVSPYLPRGANTHPSIYYTAYTVLGTRRVWPQTESRLA